MIPEMFQLHHKKYRGIGILVTCDYDLKLPASIKNANEMRETFKELGYDIHERQNARATKREIIKLLQDLSNYLKSYDGKLTNPDGRVKVIAVAFSGCGGPEESNTDKDSMSLLTWGGQNLSLKGEIMPLVVGNINRDVYKLPKLFFIDASRGKEDLKRGMDVGKAAIEDEGTHYIDSATIPDHKASGDMTEGLMDKAILENEGNYRIDYATIPDHKTTPDSVWMAELACKLRDVTMKDESLQNVAAHVKKSVQERGSSRIKQCDSIDRLITGPLYLHPDYSVPAL